MTDYKKDLELVNKELEEIEKNFNEMKSKVKIKLDKAQNEEDRKRIMNNFNNQIKKIQSNEEFITNVKKLKSKKIELEEKIKNQNSTKIINNSKNLEKLEKITNIDDEIYNLLNKYKNNINENKMQKEVISSSNQRLEKENYFTKIPKNKSINEKIKDINKMLKEFN
jgi:hypothetical protein